MSLFFDDEQPQPVEQPVASNPFASSIDQCGESTSLEVIDVENFPFDKLSTPTQNAGRGSATFIVTQTVARRALVETHAVPSPETPNQDITASAPDDEVDDDDSDREFLERERDLFSSFNGEASAGSLTNTNGPSVSSGLESGPSFEAASPTTSPLALTRSSNFDAARVVPAAVIAAEAQMRERIVLKDAEEEKQIAQLREEARKDLEEFYARYRLTGKCRKGLSNSVTDDEKRWERIGNLCDFSGKGHRGTRDVTRMRNILMHLKQKPPVVNGHHP